MNILITRKESEIIIPKAINFTELVKCSKTTLSLNMQSKMITILNKEFTESQQQWYIANLYMYMNYDSTNDYPINLEHIFEMIGFANKGNAMKTIKHNFTVNEDYKIALVHTEKRKNEGGANKEDVMLNIDTFKNLCMLAKTDKGKKIRSYYVKLENINNKLIIEELKENQKLLSDKDVQHNIDIKMSRHKILLEKFSGKKCIYIAEVSDDITKIKIGSTKDINERVKGLNSLFGKCIFLNIFECENFREVEENIFSDITMINNKCHNKVNNHQSKEIVELSKKFNYKQLLLIVENYVNKINYLNPQELLENKRIDYKTKKLNIIQQFINNGETLKDILCIFYQEIKQEDIKVEEIKPEVKNETIIVKEHFKQVTHVNGRKPKGQKVQKIDPNNLDIIIETYDSMVYALRSPENDGFQKSCILNAINKYKIYKDFRWNFIDKPLLPTVENKNLAPIRNTIVQLNQLKNEIVHTFLSKDILAKYFNIGKIRMRNIIRNGECFNSSYFIELHTCPQDLIDKYDKPIHSLLHINSKKIKQINPMSNDIIIFNNFNEISMKYGIASKTIIRAIESKNIYSGSFWEYA